MDRCEYMKMNQYSNLKPGFISPMMRIGETNPKSRPHTSIQRKPKLDSAVLPVTKQRIKTSIGCRQEVLRNEQSSMYGSLESTFTRENEIHRKRRLDYKDILHHLLDEWVPQLCDNYRPFACYIDREDTLSVLTAFSGKSTDTGRRSRPSSRISLAGSTITWRSLYILPFCFNMDRIYKYHPQGIMCTSFCKLHAILLMKIIFNIIVFLLQSFIQCHSSRMFLLVEYF